MPKSRLGNVYRGWWIVGAVSTASAMVVGSSQYSFSIFVQPLQDEFGWSRTQINASLSFAALGSLAAPLLGRLIDTRGSRPVMAVCLGMFGLSYLLRPFMTELWHWYALSALQFIGFSGAAALPAGKLVGIWFQRSRGRVMGLTMMGNNFGGLIMPPIVGASIALASWEAAYVVLGALTAGIVVISLLAIKEVPDATDRRPESDTGAIGPRVELTGWSVEEALRQKSFYLITVAVLLGTFTYGAVLPQIFAHLTNEGASTATASQAVGLLALFGMGGKVGFGYLAERITSRYALMLSLGGQAAFLLMMLESSNAVVLWISVPMFGLCMGAFGALMQLIVQDSFGVKYFGGVMGLINVTSVLSFALGPLMAGMSFDYTDSYRTAFIAVAVMFVVAIALLSQAGGPRFRASPIPVAGT